MGYGFKLLKSNGDVAMSTDNFGLQIVDDFTVSSGNSGSRTYPELSYFNILYAMTGSEYSNTSFHRELASHATLDLSGSVGAGNVPTISWSPIYQSGANSCGETTSAGVAVIKSASSGSRIEINNNKILIYDGSVLRVVLGDLTP